MEREKKLYQSDDGSVVLCCVDVHNQKTYIEIDTYPFVLCQVFFPVYKAPHIDGFQQAPYFPFA